MQSHQRPDKLCILSRQAMTNIMYAHLDMQADYTRNTAMALGKLLEARADIKMRDRPEVVSRMTKQGGVYDRRKGQNVRFSHCLYSVCYAFLAHLGLLSLGSHHNALRVLCIGSTDSGMHAVAWCFQYS